MLYFIPHHASLCFSLLHAFQCNTHNATPYHDNESPGATPYHTPQNCYAPHQTVLTLFSLLFLLPDVVGSVFSK